MVLIMRWYNNSVTKGTKGRDKTMDKIEALELAMVALEDEACNFGINGCYDAQEVIRDMIEEIKKEDNLLTSFSQ